MTGEDETTERRHVVVSTPDRATARTYFRKPTILI
jgi:hypothetical protein